MYEIGELIIYVSNGVCKLEDIGLPSISRINIDKVYYILKTV